MKCPRCGVELRTRFWEPDDRPHDGDRCADLSAERARRAEAERDDVLNQRDHHRIRGDRYERMHRATAAKLATARRALEEIGGDIRDCEGAYAYREMKRISLQALAALDAEPGKNSKEEKSK